MFYLTAKPDPFLRVGVWDFFPGFRIGCAGFAWHLFSFLSKTVLAHIFPISKKTKMNGAP